jgi:AcrR family transcriptional regulator
MKSRDSSFERSAAAEGRRSGEHRRGPLGERLPSGMTDAPNMRARTRRAVAREITEAARQLFIAQGYEATTIDQIAAAVGMSQRSMFRYFPTKVDIVLGKVDFAAEEMLEALGARPLEEPLWTSLRRMIDVHVVNIDEVERQQVAIPIQRIIFESPSVLASYLQKLHDLQDAAVCLILRRAEAAGRPYAASDPTPRAITAAAFGCLVAAQHVWLADGGRHSFAEALDRAMAAVGPPPPTQA